MHTSDRIMCICFLQSLPQGISNNWSVQLIALVTFALVHFCRTQCSTLNQSALSLDNNTLQGTCKLSTNQRLVIYAGATGLAIITNFARTIMFYFLCVNASRVLHNRMFASVLRAPILFFDTNPIGETTVVATECVHC